MVPSQIFTLTPRLRRSTRVAQIGLLAAFALFLCADSAHALRIWSIPTWQSPPLTEPQALAFDRWGASQPSLVAFDSASHKLIRTELDGTARVVAGNGRALNGTPRVFPRPASETALGPVEEIVVAATGDLLFTEGEGRDGSNLLLIRPGSNQIEWVREARIRTVSGEAATLPIAPTGLAVSRKGEIFIAQREGDDDLPGGIWALSPNKDETWSAELVVGGGRGAANNQWQKGDDLRIKTASSLIATNDGLLFTEGRAALVQAGRKATQWQARRLQVSGTTEQAPPLLRVAGGCEIAPDRFLIRDFWGVKQQLATLEIIDREARVSPAQDKDSWEEGGVADGGLIESGSIRPRGFACTGAGVFLSDQQRRGLRFVALSSSDDALAATIAEAVVSWNAKTGQYARIRAALVAQASRRPWRIRDIEDIARLRTLPPELIRKVRDYLDATDRLDWTLALRARMALATLDRLTRGEESSEEKTGP